ncbi:P12 [Cnaphalocrocis medinalis granulovirus]|uniref:p12 n=1 Tax=Cnaphalocrocis medinalis granulovirus TaxID=1750712 RepID=A0A109WXG5_9BBAC|nr:P12 [Cnaphalocrocis medinalis granulovirus]ALN42006.1 p12 [Cnaphalocrocis medinalis granulovirus]AMF83818.1 P12 [Cnaphalocrocis medinalis granulovirus]WPN08696.1 P12 [Cnaphalocrocis medinalis granulovirus]
MEDSLFSRRNDLTTNVSPPNVNVNNEALYDALLAQGVGRHIKADQSSGKINILNTLVPKTRGLKRIIKGLENNEDELVIRGADDAVEVLDVVYAIINNKFTIQNIPQQQEQQTTLQQEEQQMEY